MRKIALFVALAMIAASPALAAEKKKKAAAKPAMTAAEQANDNSYRLVRDSLPMWLPSWAQPIYHSTNKTTAVEAKPAKAKKKAKTAAKS